MTAFRVPYFEIVQRQDPGGFLRLTLLGALDLSTIARLKAYLRQLKYESERVRLDLSRLEFLDSIGVSVLAGALIDARRDGWQLEVYDQLSRPVRKTVDLAGISSCFWPEPRD
jgi:anti-anti-sigma factor